MKACQPLNIFESQNIGLYFTLASLNECCGIVLRNGGGGVRVIVTPVLQGGEGGKKIPKKVLRNMFMAPSQDVMSCRVYQYSNHTESLG